MGTCCSRNEAKIRKINTYKSRKSTSCLGSLCNDSYAVQIQDKNQFGNESANIPEFKSTYTIYHKNDKLNNNLNEIIGKYNYKFKITKINYIQLFNIFMNYRYDFTQSNFVIFDTREEINERNQIFLKKFHQVNYTLKQLESMADERKNKFYKFLNNKNIIFILKDDSSLEIMEQYIIYFIVNNNEREFSIKNIYILSEYIQEYNKENISNNNYLENLYYFIDEDTIYDYSPKILININDIKSIYFNSNNPDSNNAYVFINTYPHIANKNDNKNKIINKFDINYLCDKNTEDPDNFLNFISKFNIYYILNFILLNNDLNQNNSEYIIHKESKRNKVDKEEKKSLIIQVNVSIPKNVLFEEFFLKIKNEFFSILEDFKNQIIQNNCILIQFDDNIDILFKYKLIYIIAFRLTGLSYDDIFSYLKCNFYDIDNQSIVEPNKDEIIKLLV